MAHHLKNRTAIAGVGSSDFAALYRSTDPQRSGVTMSVAVLNKAVEDAGLKLSDIDGPICSGVTPEPSHYQNLAYRAGLREARYLIDLYNAAFGMASPGAQYAMLYSRYLDKFGYLGREADLQAAVPIAFRKHAALNPFATMREPITVDDYLRSPYVARPLRRLDYCLISDGAVCVIMTGAERAKTLKKPPVYVSAFANHASLWEPYVPPQDPQLYYHNVALMRPEEGPFMYCNVVGARYEDLRADLPMEVVFEDVNDEIALPKFRLLK